MQGLLRLSRGIDWLNERVGRAVIWLVLITVLTVSYTHLTLPTILLV